MQFLATKLNVLGTITSYNRF